MKHNAFLLVFIALIALVPQLEALSQGQTRSEEPTNDGFAKTVPTEHHGHESLYSAPLNTGHRS